VCGIHDGVVPQITILSCRVLIGKHRGVLLFGGSAFSTSKKRVLATGRAATRWVDARRVRSVFAGRTVINRLQSTARVLPGWLGS
jgi:hypothetical protein